MPLPSFWQFAGHNCSSLVCKSITQSSSSLPGISQIHYVCICLGPNFLFMRMLIALYQESHLPQYDFILTNQICNGPVLPKAHVLGYLELGLQHMYFEEDTVQPISASFIRVQPRTPKAVSRGL